MGDKREFPWAATGISICFLMGAFLRIWQFAANRSLWLDEAMLALNVVNRSWVELTQPLDYNQGAPIGFLFVQKLMIVLFGNQDLYLRLFPLAASLLSIFLIWKVAQGFLSKIGVLIVLGFFVLSTQLIYYSSEAKQYASDVLVALLLLFVFSRYLAQARRRFLWLAAAGALGMWLSHPTVFVLAGIGLSLSLDALIKKEWGRLWQLGLVFLAWLVSFAILYFVSLRFLATNTYLNDYWSGGFMPIPPWIDINWFRHTWFDLINNWVGLPKGIIRSIGGLVLLAGCVSISLRKWQWALVLIAPFAFTLFASGLEKYPFSGRLILFLLPSVFLLMAEGVERTRLLLSRIHPWLAYSVTALLVLLFLYQSASQALENVRQPDLREDIKPALSYLSQNRQSTDLIYVYHGSAPAFKYYSSFYNISGRDYVVGISSPRAPDKYLKDINKLIGRARVWIIFSHECPLSLCKVDERNFFVDHLNRLGKRIQTFKSTGVTLYLYDLSVPKP